MLARGRVGPLRVRVGVLAVKTNITEAENCSKNIPPEPLRRWGDIKKSPIYADTISNKHIWSVDVPNVVKSPENNITFTYSSPEKHVGTEARCDRVFKRSWPWCSRQPTTVGSATLRKDVIDEATAGELWHAWRLTAESPSLVCPSLITAWFHANIRRKMALLKAVMWLQPTSATWHKNGRLIKRKCGTAVQEMRDSCPHVVHCSAASRSRLFYMFYVWHHCQSVTNGVPFNLWLHDLTILNQISHY